MQRDGRPEIRVIFRNFFALLFMLPWVVRKQVWDWQKIGAKLTQLKLATLD